MKRLLKIMVFLATLMIANTANTAVQVVLIPGFGGEEAVVQMEFLKQQIPDSLVITPKYSLGDVAGSAEELWFSLKVKKIEKADFIGFSWGGLVVKEFASNHPEMVGKIIFLGTPNGGYKSWLIPRFIFKARDDFKRDIPVFVIAGIKSSEKWYLKGSNDGTVELDSVFDINRPINDSKIFKLSHVELLESREVAEQVIAWLKK
ncbi:MAG: alpha/beta hydrolase [Patescibacteria group bacterium]